MNPLYCDLRIPQNGQVRPRALIFEVANGWSLIRHGYNHAFNTEYRERFAIH